jgi:DNA-binding CsgD family transcriptional regulator
MTVAGPPLLERDAELAALEALLADAAEGRGAVAVVEGPAGIGKTELLLAAVRATPRTGLRALVARAAELERDFPFGVARQLVEPAFLHTTPPERAALLDGPARRAGAALDLDGAQQGDTEPAAAVHGLYWLVANIAADAPLLLVVDDLHWADGPSVRFLAYLARRLDGLPVAVVTSVRTGEPLDPAADALLAEPATVRIRPSPLGAAAVARVVEERLGPPDPAFADACWTGTGGNPLLLAELTAELARRETAPTADAASELEALVPERLADGVRRRLESLGPEAQALATALVVLGDGGEPGTAGALAGLDAHATSRAAARLADADLVLRDESLRFRHPLVRAAVAATVADADRAHGHARAARLLAARGESPVRIAGHLVASPPGDGDPWAVAALREAARAAQRQGAPEHAVAPLRRALAEPADDATRPALLRELGIAELAGMQSAAAEHLRAAYDLAADPGERADIALELGTALYGAARHAEAVEVLRQAIDELGDRDRERRLGLEATLAVTGRYDLATEKMVRGRVHAVADGLRGETPAERRLLAVAAVEDPGSAAEGLARAAELQERVVGEAPWRDPSEGVGTVLMYVHAGRPDRARALTDRMVEWAIASDSPVRHAMALVTRSAVGLDVGELDEAEADIRAALADLSSVGHAALPTVYGQLAQVLTERGELAEAQAVLVEHGLDRELPEQMILNPLLHARALLRLAQGRWDDAAADARELGRRHEQWGMRRPSPNWRAVAAEALRARGDVGEARALADTALDLARQWDTPKAIAIALRARALAAEGGPQVALLEEAQGRLRDTPWRLERARVSLDLGAALRRDGRRRDARDRLLEAMDEASRCGAALLAERAAQELRAAGARPRRHAITGSDALTTSERRVAALAGRGRSNREIAHELFITVATVETHLRRTYRKLGIDGRAGLPADLEP